MNAIATSRDPSTPHEYGPLNWGHWAILHGQEIFDFIKEIDRKYDKKMEAVLEAEREKAEERLINRSRKIWKSIAGQLESSSKPRGRLTRARAARKVLRSDYASSAELAQRIMWSKILVRRASERQRPCITLHVPPPPPPFPPPIDEDRERPLRQSKRKVLGSADHLNLPITLSKDNGQSKDTERERKRQRVNKKGKENKVRLSQCFFFSN